MQYNRARYYDPATARFISRDSVAGNQENPITQNPYLYAGDNPGVYSDPSGKQTISQDAAFGAAIGSLFGPEGTACGGLLGALTGVLFAGGVIAWDLIQNGAISPIHFSEGGISKGKPIDAPSGTLGIDQALKGESDLIHKIKDKRTGIGAAPNDDVWITTDGEILTTGSDGKAIPHGNVEAWR